MTDVVWTNLVTGSTALLVAVAGIAGTCYTSGRSIRAARNKENFQIRKEHYEGRWKALAMLRRISDPDTGIPCIENDRPAETITAVKDTVMQVSNCIAAAPWAFSKDIRGLERQLSLASGSLDAICSGYIALCEHPDSSESARSFVSTSAQKVVEDLIGMYVLAERELESVVQEFEEFIANGIMN